MTDPVTTSAATVPLGITDLLDRYAAGTTARDDMTEPTTNAAPCWWCHKTAAECDGRPGDLRCCVDCHHSAGESPQEVTYQEAILDGADPMEGDYADA